MLSRTPRGKLKRAATANGANNVAELIFYHRVIRSGGTLGGHAYGLGIKRELLERGYGARRDQ